MGKDTLQVIGQEGVNLFVLFREGVVHDEPGQNWEEECDQEVEDELRDCDHANDFCPHRQ